MKKLRAALQGHYASFVFAVLLVFAPCASLAADYAYITNGGTITITSYAGAGGVVAIPGTINGLKVTAIGDFALMGNTNLTGVVIPDSITSIASGAFYNCSALAAVQLGNGVSMIWGEAFSRCGSLTNIVIPDSVTTIDYGAFAGCTNLTEVIIGNAVSEIFGEAFSDCAHLTRITIPDSVAYLGPAVFSGCVNLTNAVIGNGLPAVPYLTFQNCTRLENVTLGTNISGIADLAFSYCSTLRGLFFKGNAPSPHEIGSGLNVSPAAIAYYLPGTTGWGPTLSPYPIPTALWDPRPQTSPPGFGIGPAGFGFTITATTNIPVVVTASANLTGTPWTPLQTVTLTNGSTYFTDHYWTNYAARFYRLSFP